MVEPYEFEDMICLSAVTPEKKGHGTLSRGKRYQLLADSLEKLAKKFSEIDDVLALRKEILKTSKKVMISVSRELDSPPPPSSLEQEKRAILKAVLSQMFEQQENCGRLSQLQLAFAQACLRSPKAKLGVTKTIEQDDQFFDSCRDLALRISVRFNPSELAELKEDNSLYNFTSLNLLKETMHRSLKGDVYTGYDYLSKYQLTGQIFDARMDAAFFALDTTKQILDLLKLEITGASHYGHLGENAWKKVDTLKTMATEMIIGIRQMAVALDQTTNYTGLRSIQTEAETSRAERKKYSQLPFRRISLSVIPVPISIL